MKHQGKIVGDGNGHVWVYAEDPNDIERARIALIVRAAQEGMAWQKPRFSRHGDNKVTGFGLTTILDPSVWTPGRLVFDGQPTASEGFTIDPMTAAVHHREGTMVDTSTLTLPDAKKIQQITREAGIEIAVRTGSSGLKVTANDLTLDSEIETKQYGVVTVRELIKRGTTEKIRCQTPFRASESWAAFYNVNPDGIPFVYDNGTSTTHWLNEFEVDEAKVILAAATIERLMSKIKEDTTDTTSTTSA